MFLRKECPMKSFTINNELTLSCPDGFREMSTEELNKISSSRNPNRFGIWDEERRLMLAILWYKANVFQASLTDPRTSLRSVEMQLQSLLRPNGFTKTGSFHYPIAGQQAKAFSYAYMVTDLLQTGEVFMFRNKRMYYTIFTYAWEAIAGEVQETLRGILDSMRIG